MRVLTGLLLTLVACFCQLASAETYYIAPQASNSATGISPTEPLHSLDRVNELAKPGDVFLLTAGIYELGQDPPSLSCSGTASEPIRIEAVPGARPRLRFEGWSGMRLGPGCAYVEVSGLDIEGPARFLTLAEAQTTEKPQLIGRLNGNGLTIDGRKADEEQQSRPHHITLRNLRIWGCPGGGISAIQSDYVTIEGCTVFDCAWYSRYACSGISIWQPWAYDREPGHHICILNNRCFGNRQYLPARPNGTITDGNGIIIDDSRNTQQGSKLGPYPSRILIQGNVCIQNGGSGIHTYKSDHLDILDNVVVLNNQTPSISHGQIFVNDSSDIRIVGNTITRLLGNDQSVTFILPISQPM